MINNLTKDEARELAFDYFRKYGERCEENLATINLEVLEEIITALGLKDGGTTIFGATGRELYIGNWSVIGDKDYDSTAVIAVNNGVISFKEIAEGKMPFVVNIPALLGPEEYSDARAFLKFVGFVFRNNLAK